MKVFDFRVHIHKIYECCILYTIFQNVILLVNGHIFLQYRPIKYEHLES